MLIGTWTIIIKFIDNLYILVKVKNMGMRNNYKSSVMIFTTANFISV